MGEAVNQISESNQTLGEAIQSLIESNINRLNSCFLAQIKSVEENRITIAHLCQKEGEEEFAIPDVLVGYPNCKNVTFSLKLQEGDCGIALVCDRDITEYKEKGEAGIAPSERHHFLGDCLFIPLSLFNSVLEKDTCTFAENFELKIGGEFKFDIEKPAQIKGNDSFSILSGKTMEIKSDDAVNISSGKAMEIKSDDAVTIKATKDADLSSDGAVNIKATQDLSLSGLKVEIKGSAGTLFDVLDGLITTLMSAKTINAVPGSPLTFDPQVIGELTKAKTMLAGVLK